MPFPPLPEQRRIVAKIEELFSQLDAGVEELKKAKTQLKRYRQSVLKAAFEGKLTEEWRKKNLTTKTPRHKEGTKPETAQELLDRIREERKKALGTKYKEPPPLDTSELPELPDSWAWASLDELAAKITDGEHIRPRTASDGVPFLSAKDVRDDGVSFDDPLYVSPSDAGTFRRRCDPCRGDILVVSRGATVGRTCTVNTDKRFCLLGSVILMKLYDALSPSFVAYVLESEETQRRLKALCGSTAQQAIYLRDIRWVPLPVPPPDEQREVVSEVDRRLSVADAEEKAIEAALKQAARLRQSILKRAFEGKLVPQDPSDEPAERLLERIRAEKAKHTAGRPRARGRRTATAWK
jgi:type I restriction enzyme S subunit